MALPSLVEIGTTTKNRRDDLRDTLAQIAGYGWGEFGLETYTDFLGRAGDES